jgi:hypothetical protein
VPFARTREFRPTCSHGTKRDAPFCVKALAFFEIVYGSPGSLERGARSEISKARVLRAEWPPDSAHPDLYRSRPNLRGFSDPTSSVPLLPNPVRPPVGVAAAAAPVPAPHPTARGPDQSSPSCCHCSLRPAVAGEKGEGEERRLLRGRRPGGRAAMVQRLLRLREHG